MDFGNNLNWDLVLRRSYFAQTTPNEVKGFLPIPSISILVDRHILTIGASSTKAKPNWYLAAYVTPKLLFSPSSTSEFVAAVQTQERRRIKLNTLNLVQFTNFGLSPYLLEISIPYWHQEMNLEIWKYQGDESTKPSNELIADLKSDIERIELKLDSFSP